MKKERAISVSLTNGAECICDPDIVLGDRYGLWDIDNEISPRGTLLDLNTAWELFISKQGLSGYTFEQQEDSEHERITYILVDKDKNPVGPEFTVETDNGEILVPITETITSLTAEKGKYYRLDVPVETLAITLPAMDAVTSVKKVGIYFTAGTTPDVTITAADNKPVVFQDGFELEAGKTYEVNALFNGSAWVVNTLTIILPPMNIITYSASAKLAETTDYYSTGLHTNVFSGKNGQLTMTSHTFENGAGTIEFDGDVTSIGYQAFFNCSGLTSVIIPDSVTNIGDSVFSGCSGLTSIGGVGSGASVEIPRSVTSIGGSAFYNCSSLTSVTIPDSVTSIDDGAFGGCTSLTSIVVDSANTVYDSRDNCNAIIKTSANELIAGCKNTVILNTVTSIGNSAFSSCEGLTSITIPDSVTSIGNDAFNDCKGLTSITISNSVTSIGESAFYGCNGLTNITIPDSVTSIGVGAFGGCRGLTSVTIGNGVTSIDKYAFNYCSVLTSVIIGSSVTSIGDYTFRDCTSLTNITSLATTAPTIGDNTFWNVKTGGTLTVPNGSSGYGAWMSTGDYYLGKYNWTKVEQ